MEEEESIKKENKKKKGSMSYAWNRMVGDLLGQIGSFLLRSEAQRLEWVCQEWYTVANTMRYQCAMNRYPTSILHKKTFAPERKGQLVGCKVEGSQPTFIYLRELSVLEVIHEGKEWCYSFKKMICAHVIPDFLNNRIVCRVWLSRTPFVYLFNLQGKILGKKQIHDSIIHFFVADTGKLYVTKYLKPKQSNVFLLYICEWEQEEEKIQISCPFEVWQIVKIQMIGKEIFLFRLWKNIVDCVRCSPCTVLSHVSFCDAYLTRMGILIQEKVIYVARFGPGDVIILKAFAFGGALLFSHTFHDFTKTETCGAPMLQAHEKDSFLLWLRKGGKREIRIIKPLLFFKKKNQGK